MPRLFVGLDIPSEIKTSLSFLRMNIQGAKWTNTDNFHLTLFFIGEVHSREVDNIIHALEGIKLAPFELTLKGVNLFSSKNNPRLLWASIEGNSQLMKLQEAVQRLLTPIGGNLDQRKFTPHITLARLKNTPFHSVGQFIEAYSLFKSTPISVEHFHLFSSHFARKMANSHKNNNPFQSHHPLYEIIHSFPLH